MGALLNTGALVLVLHGLPHAGQHTGGFADYNCSQLFSLVWRRQRVFVARCDLLLPASDCGCDLGALGAVSSAEDEIVFARFDPEALCAYWVSAILYYYYLYA